MYTIKASLGVQAEGRTRATYCLDTRDANPYEQGAQLRGVRIRVGLREHAVRSNPWLLCVAMLRQQPCQLLLCSK